MRGAGVIEDGYAFTEEDLERGTPRFWWGPRKRAAFDRALARRGLSRREREDEDDHETTGSGDRDEWSSTAAPVALALADEPLKKTEPGGEPGGSDGFSDAGGADGGGGDSGGGGGDSGGSAE